MLKQCGHKFNLKSNNLSTSCFICAFKVSFCITFFLEYQMRCCLNHPPSSKLLFLCRFEYEAETGPQHRPHKWLKRKSKTCSAGHFLIFVFQKVLSSLPSLFFPWKKPDIKIDQQLFESFSLNIGHFPPILIFSSLHCHCTDKWISSTKKTVLMYKKLTNTLNLNYISKQFVTVFLFLCFYKLGQKK